MLTEIRSAVRPALVMLVLFTILLGFAFPLAITGIAQVAFPEQANGSLIRERGTVIGSELIGQGFATPRYFHSRPSAAGDGYDASASAATNLAPGSQDLRDAIAARVEDARAQGLTGVSVAPDLFTTSASGLDPHISPEAAFAQVDRVARARGLTSQSLRSIVERSVEYPLFGFIGEPHVNVLMLNRHIDRISATLRQ